MKIEEVKLNKKQYIDLLLLADEQENMIDRYLDKGTMFTIEDNGVKGVCVVTCEDGGVLEIKNIAVLPDYQNKGYGRALIEFIENKFRDTFSTIRVGTGDSPLTIPFYKKCGFSEAYRIKNFFTDNYDRTIIECGIQLVDMVYLEKFI